MLMNKPLNTSYDSATLLALVPTLMADTHPDHVIPHLLQTLCQTFGWHCGEFWSLDSTTSTIHCTHRWCDRSLIDPDPLAHVPPSSIPCGTDAIGTLCETKTYVWLSDADTLRSHDSIPHHAAMQSGLLCPVLDNDSLMGILGFLSMVPRPYEEHVLQTIRQSSVYLAMFLCRQRALSVLTNHLSSATSETDRIHAQLLQARRIKDDFLAIISHELRTPIHTILGLSGALTDYAHGPLTDEQMRALVTIEQSSRHLLSHVNTMLDIVRIESGAMVPQHDVLPVELLCVSCLHAIRPYAESKQLSSSFTIDDPSTSVSADVRHLKQVLVSLLRNAVKFTPECHAIGLDVVTNPLESVITFTVWDEGIGIAADDQARLFQPFVQLDSSLSRHHEGVGLGLALVAGLISLHGGSLTLQSTPGVGSRFTVTLPTWPPFSPSSSISAPQPTYTCLLAASNQLAIDLMSHALAHLGAATIVCRHPDDILLAAIEHLPSHIFLDRQMMNLSTVLQSLRDHDRLQHLPRLVLATIALAHDRDACLADGATHYLAKPVGLHTLRQLLADASTVPSF